MKTLKSNVVYGSLSELKKHSTLWGTKAPLFSEWGELRATGILAVFNRRTEHKNWSSEKTEKLCLVIEGKGSIINGRKFNVKTGQVFKIFAGQEPIIQPIGTLKLLVVEIPGIRIMAPEFSVVDPSKIPQKVYEYEALGQEIVTCNYSPGIGLLRFVFPIDRIPIHIHPFSARLIFVNSGKGYTYVATAPENGKRYEMVADSFCLFPKGTVHTNGSVPGSLYDVYAFQLPWVEPKIDNQNIAGDPKFVKYIASEPPRPLWKTIEELKRAAEKLTHEN